MKIEGLTKIIGDINKLAITLDEKIDNIDFDKPKSDERVDMYYDASDLFSEAVKRLAEIYELKLENY